ncbi:glycosyltransferase, partial [Streptomyces albidoflavus]
VALEAQACGLPVLYQPVPGLNEALGASAAPTDFGRPGAVARDLQRMRASSSVLPALRAAGLANARRCPLSATQAALHALSRQVLG